MVVVNCESDDIMVSISFADKTNKISSNCCRR